MVNPKQSRRVVEKQLATARKALLQKQRTLMAATGKSQITRLDLEIDAIQRRIREYEDFLRSKGD